MTKIMIIVAAFLSAFTTSAEESIAELLSQAKLLEYSDSFDNDDSPSQRLYAAILEKDPENPRALWNLAFNRYMDNLANVHSLNRRSDNLIAFGPFVKTVVDHAKKRGEIGFAHFVSASYASYYRNYERAMNEIDLALANDPDSIYYLFHKGNILANKGNWEKNDEEILAGMAIIEQAREKNHPGSDYYIPGADLFYFDLAIHNSQLSTKNAAKTIEYYLRSVEINRINERSRAYAWNNLSIAYRKSGECQKAVEASQKALEIADFGAARSNLQYAEFCLEMENANDKSPKS
ncbi:MAG: hypothetical protein ACU833_04610 [Gammaproteobacteria bacterium]